MVVVATQVVVVGVVIESNPSPLGGASNLL